MRKVINTKSVLILLIILLMSSTLFAQGLSISSEKKKDRSGAISYEKIYYGSPNRKRSFWEELDFYIQPQVGLGYNLTAGQHSIIMLGAYTALEYKFLRLGFAGNIGSSLSYYGVQSEVKIPLHSIHGITLRLGNWGRKSTNAGIFYEARIENISALIGVEFCTDDIILFDDYSYMFTIGMGIILDDMNY